ncbi:hypothetical protein ACFS5J_02525 [Flavobacterium chuncheonense]|uniref:DUF4352 domain-containing protein n=1 Tax=Flavobacterium chuncheonense TaxID=2026653 RepID=A0ABW5YIQ5_9FLAO
MKTKVLFIVVITSLLSCSSPIDKKFNEETVKEDIEAIKGRIDSTDLQLLMGSIISLKFQEKKLEDMTYADILDNGKKLKEEQDKFEAEQKIIAEEAAKKEAIRLQRLNEVIMVSCFEKGFAKYDYEDYITYKFVIKNKSNKNVRALKGNITFTNLFDDEISSLNFVYDESIEAGTTATWNAQTDYNQFKDEDQLLKNKELKDLKVIWKPETIIFEDGTRLD